MFWETSKIVFSDAKEMFVANQFCCSRYDISALKDLSKEQIIEKEITNNNLVPFLELVTVYGVTEIEEISLGELEGSQRSQFAGENHGRTWKNHDQHGGGKGPIDPS
jgi:hypothetical protein